jgi:hypothetical protein
MGCEGAGEVNYLEREVMSASEAGKAHVEGHVGIRGSGDRGRTALLLLHLFLSSCASAALCLLHVLINRNHTHQLMSSALRVRSLSQLSRQVAWSQHILP